MQNAIAVYRQLHEQIKTRTTTKKNDEKILQHKIDSMLENDLQVSI